MSKCCSHGTFLHFGLQSSSIGFGADVRPKEEELDLSLVTPEDLTKFGMIPEFIGRFTTTCALKQLRLEQLVSVLSSVKNSFLEQYEYLFSLDDVRLTFTPDAIKQIAQNCIDLKTGARGLHSELERILLPHMFHVRKYKENNIEELIIDQELVIEPKALV